MNATNEFGLEKIFNLLNESYLSYNPYEHSTDILTPFQQRRQSPQLLPPSRLLAHQLSLMKKDHSLWMIYNR